MKHLVTLTMILFFMGIAGNGICYDKQKSIATGSTYFDMSTGHKYTKNSDNTYTEYTRTGKVFKTNVPNTQPHLSSSKYVTQIEEDSFVLYKSYNNYKPTLSALKMSDPHPTGSQSIQVLISAKQLIKRNINRSNSLNNGVVLAQQD